MSTPTISRFESGARDIQLSTVTTILRVLGMLDERVLIFSDAKPRATGDAVVFQGRDGDKKVTCAILREALEEHFDGARRDLLKIFAAHRERIEHEARRKYLAGRVEPDGSVQIAADDL